MGRVNMTLNEQETMTKLDRAYPDTSILRVLPARGWRAVVADEDARGCLVEIRHLALVEPIGEPEERRVVVVIERDGRAVLHPGVVALVATMDGMDLSDLGQGMRTACDPRVGEGTVLDPRGSVASFRADTAKPLHLGTTAYSCLG